jgi:hypothetical protein
MLISFNLKNADYFHGLEKLGSYVTPSEPKYTLPILIYNTVCTGFVSTILLFKFITQQFE